MITKSGLYAKWFCNDRYWFLDEDIWWHQRVLNLCLRTISLHGLWYISIHNILIKMYDYIIWDVIWSDEFNMYIKCQASYSYVALISFVVFPHVFHALVWMDQTVPKHFLLHREQLAIILFFGYYYYSELMSFNQFWSQ